LRGIPTPAHAAEVREAMGSRYSESSKASISAALTHWDAVREQWSWDRVILTGDERRGAKLATFVLYLMACVPHYPNSTITNYVWALSAYMESELQADPRVNVIGWSFFIASVNLFCAGGAAQACSFRFHQERVAGGGCYGFCHGPNGDCCSSLALHFSTF
jgi:hypothetical protein